MILVAGSRGPGSRSRGAARRPGLSLIEVLLASAIFLMSIVAISRLVDMGTDHERDARLYAQAARLAQSRLAAAEAGEIPVGTGSEGNFDGTESHWSWKTTSEPAGPPNLYLITATVSCTYRGRPFELSVSQMVFDPNYLGTAAEAVRPEAGEAP
jgi:Tfp pilus assembly protein PilV